MGTVGKGRVLGTKGTGLPGIGLVLVGWMWTRNLDPLYPGTSYPPYTVLVLPPPTGSTRY